MWPARYEHHIRWACDQHQCLTKLTSRARDDMKGAKEWGEGASSFGQSTPYMTQLFCSIFHLGKTYWGRGTQYLRTFNTRPCVCCASPFLSFRTSNPYKARLGTHTTALHLRDQQVQTKARKFTLRLFCGAFGAALVVPSAIRLRWLRFH